MVLNTRWRRPDSQTVRVALMVVCLAVLTVALGYRHLGERPHSDVGVSLPWWFFVAAFALTEAVVMNIQVRREAQTISTSELPLVLGLFLAAPGALLLGRLVGSCLIFVFYRRSSALKSTFNAALVSAETVVAISVFHLILPGMSALGPRSWLAAYAATLAANALGSVAIGLVIAIYDGASTLRQLFREVTVGQLTAPVVVTVALVAVTSLAGDPHSGWLLAACAGVLLLAYHAYSSLAERHLSLERLYEFSQAVTNSPETDVVVTSVLEEAKAFMASQHVRIALPGSSPGTTNHLTLADDGTIVCTTNDDAATDVWMSREVVERNASLVLPRKSRDPKIRSWLDANGLRDAAAVPLKASDGPMGLLVVGDRLGEVRTFDKEDILLLETLANHASVALQKGELIDQLKHDALHDALTKLPNRTHLQRLMHQHLGAVGTGASVDLAVMIIDLDGFKEVNDTLGHDQGDLVLQEVAQRLVAAVGHVGSVARLGGDEFAVLVPHPGTREVAYGVGEMVIAALEEPVWLEDVHIEVGASVGISLSPEHGRDGSVLLKRADMAMYDAKSGEGVKIYEPRIDTASSRRLSMASSLRTALHAGEIEVHVQPQADALTGEVWSVEALARWNSPTSGPISPGEFIPVAERSGLIKPLTMLVLDTSIAAAAAWQHLGTRISVNLSPRSLLDHGLAKDVASLLQRHQLRPEALILEITENAVMSDPDRAVDLLHQLADMGIRLSVDDFGTGYSSLSYLKRLPVHEVKIDRSFITNLTAGSDDYSIVRSIVDLGTNLGLDIVAEGVEHQAAWDLLRDIGCTRVQGWHISRPMPIGAAGSWLDQRAGEVSPVRGLVRPDEFLAPVRARGSHERVL